MPFRFGLFELRRRCVFAFRGQRGNDVADPFHAPMFPKLPWWIKREIGKVLCTLGFARRGSVLWNEANASRAAALCRPLPDNVVEQIIAQGQYDPSILPVGVASLDALRRVDAADIMSRGGIDLRGIMDSIPERPDIIFVVSSLRTKLEIECASIVEALLVSRFYRALIVVTEEEAGSDADTSSLLFAGAARVVYWRNACGPGHGDDTVLACLLQALKPKVVVVIESVSGLKVVARFGRALSQQARLFCGYFVADDSGQGVLGVAASHLLRTLPFATVVVAGETSAARLQQRHGEASGTMFVVLPPRLPMIDSSAFEARSIQRKNRICVRGPQRKAWIWISPVERRYGTDVLAAVARLRPSERFDIFGPLKNSLSSQGLDRPNIIYRGILSNLSDADFASYDGFVFTSSTDDMLSTVFEVAQHAIPLILSKVGILSDTLDAESTFFVDASNGGDTAALAFDDALSRVLLLDADATVALTRAARERVMSRHAPEVFARNCEEIFLQRDERA
jgi:hypothetical protein